MANAVEATDQNSLQLCHSRLYIEAACETKYYWDSNGLGHINLIAICDTHSIPKYTSRHLELFSIVRKYLTFKELKAVLILIKNYMSEAFFSPSPQRFFFVLIKIHKQNWRSNVAGKPSSFCLQ